jgi:plasmid maintenance system antidote protein VapI
MDNVLMRYGRESGKHSLRRIADSLGISVKQYREMEAGKAPISYQQAAQLGQLFGIGTHYLYEASLVMDLLSAKDTVLKLKKKTITKLKRELRLCKQTVKEK